MRRWIYEAHCCVGRVADITAWKLQPFSRLVPVECGILGLTDKGMNDMDEPRLVTPYKKTQVRAAMKAAATVGDKERIRRACTVFNMELGSRRVENEIMIGDMMRWGAARGSGQKNHFMI